MKEKNTKQPPVKPQTLEQRAVVARVLELKDTLGIATDSELARDYLGGMHQGRWGRLRDDNYNGDVVGSIRELRQAINRMEAVIEQRGLQQAVDTGLGEAYHLLPLFAAIEANVAATMAETGQNRLVFAALPTGGGKSATCRYLRDKYKARVIHARASYRRSGMPFLADLAAAFGLKAPHGLARAEDVVFAKMRQARGLLCIDEANNFGTDAIDELKTILNTTGWAVAFFCTPQHFKNMMSWNWHHADQLLRRARVILEAPPIVATDVRPFVEHIGLNGCRKEACEAIAEAANKFGHYDLISQRVAPALARAGHPAMDDVRQAIRRAQDGLRSEALAKAGRK